MPQSCLFWRLCSSFVLAHPPPCSFHPLLRLHPLPLPVWADGIHRHWNVGVPRNILWLKVADWARRLSPGCHTTSQVPCRSEINTARVGLHHKGERSHYDAVGSGCWVEPVPSQEIGFVPASASWLVCNRGRVVWFKGGRDMRELTENRSLNVTGRAIWKKKYPSICSFLTFVLLSRLVWLEKQKEKLMFNGSSTVSNLCCFPPPPA